MGGTGIPRLTARTDGPPFTSLQIVWRTRISEKPTWFSSPAEHSNAKLPMLPPAPNPMPFCSGSRTPVKKCFGYAPIKSNVWSLFGSLETCPPLPCPSMLSLAFMGAWPWSSTFLQLNSSVESHQVDTNILGHVCV